MDTPSPRFELDSQVEWSHRMVGGKTTFVAHQTATGRFFHFGAEEARVFHLLGGHTAQEVVDRLASDGLIWSPDDLMQFIAQLQSSHLIRLQSQSIQDWVSQGGDSMPMPSAAQGSSNQADVPPPPDAPTPPSPSAMNRVAMMLGNVVSQKFPLFDGQRFSQNLDRHLGWTQSPGGIAAWAALMVITLVALWRNALSFGAELTRLFDSNLYLATIAFWVIAKVVHECGHATAAAYHRVRVRQIGVMFFLAAPLAYVDVTDAWKLPRRVPRIQIALGGVYFELAVAAIAFWIWKSFPETLGGHLAAQMALVAGPATILINANPLLRLDGYFVVSDLANISNLRMHGRNQLGGLVNWALVGKSIDLPLLTGWRRPFATIHAAASVVFQLVWMSGLVFAVAFWMRGLGVLLAIVAALLWGILPLARWTIGVWNLTDAQGSTLGHRRRLIGVYASALFFLPILLGAQSPLARRVPVAVQFQDEQRVRAMGDALVKAIHVEPGRRVYRGTLLVELDDPDLRLRRADLSGQADMAAKQAASARRRREFSLAQSHAQRHEKLLAQVAELDQQIQGLTIHAHREGLVIGSDLDRWENRFLDAGEELFRIGDPSEKELLIAVPPSDVEAYRRASQTQTPMPVRLRGGVQIAVVPASLAPRSKREIPHPALAAGAGGPLAIESLSDRESTSGAGYQLIEPHMHSRTPLDPMASHQVRVGQIGMLTIADNRSVYERLKDYLLR